MAEKYLDEAAAKTLDIADKKTLFDLFVRKIEKGAADRSYGIQVARLAGLPQKVIDRAKAVLSELESEGNSIVVNLGEKPAKKTRRSKPEKTKELYDGESNFKQLSFF